MAKQPKLPLTNLVTALLQFKANDAGHKHITVALDMLAPLDTADLKKLWDVEHLINSLPHAYRLHVSIDEQGTDKHPLFEHGRKYRVWYRIPGVHRKDRVFIGTFIGMDRAKIQFSLRPEAGTSWIESPWLIDAEEVDKSVAHRAPRG
jgi:hypothetical protein